jgi:hypothetical protein
MAKQLETISIVAPGFYGVNTQASSVGLDQGFALEATNCVIDSFGRLGARKGYYYQTEGNTGVNLKGLHDFIDITGLHTHGAWTDTGFYIVDGANLTSVTYNGSNTINGVNWQAATLNDAAYLFDKNYEPIYFNPSTGVLDDIKNVTLEHPVTITSSGTTATVTHTAHGFATGQEVTISGCTQTEYNGTFTITVTGTNTYTYTMPNSTSSPATGTPVATWQKTDPPKGNCVLSAYGRLWVAGVDSNKSTVYWSNLVDGTDFDSGDSGSIDLTAVLVQGNDEIIALGAHSGRLIIFLKNSIVIYGDNSSTSLDPTAMTLVEIIHGTGCIARDSVQNTGSDIIFLSKTGLMSLGRLIQEKSQPERDLSRNIRDEFVRAVQQEDVTQIRSVYNPIEGFYLLYLPSFQLVYCFDMKQAMQDGSCRVTTWTGQTYNNLYMVDNAMWLAHADGIAIYSGYQDNGQSYRIKYYTNHFDFGDATRIKYLKRVGVTVIGGVNQTIYFKAGFDYSDQYRNFTATLDGGRAAEYNVSEYNESEYTSGVLADNIRTPLGGQGSVVQAGFEAVINGSKFSMQRLDIYVKGGRTY